MYGKPTKVSIRGVTRWRVDFRDAAGKRQRPTFATKAEADDKQKEVNTAPKTLQPLHALVDADVTLAAFAAEWFFDRRCAPKGWGVCTERSHRYTMMARLLPFRVGGKVGTITVGGIDFPADSLGATKVRELTPRHVDALVKGMSAEGFAPGTIKLTLTLFAALLDRAVSRGLLPANPLTKDLRKDLKPHLDDDEDTDKHFTADQARRFLAESAKSSRLHALYATGFSAGLRIGELVGLQLDDVQSTGLRVERQLDPAASSHAPVTLPPKGSKPGKPRTRTVDLGSDLHALLSRIIATRPALAMQRGWRPVPPWLFLTDDGGTLRRQVVWRDFQRVLRRAGLDGLGLSPHSLRHTYATLHVERGATPAWLQRQLGHASIKLTMDLYAKHAKLTDQAGADALAALLGNKLATGAGF